MEVLGDATIEELMGIEAAKVAKESAFDRWTEIRSTILPTGIKPVTEDYNSLPKCLIRKAGMPVDEWATIYGYGYEDEFVNMVADAYAAYVRTRDMKLPRVKRHALNPDVQEVLDCYYEIRALCLDVLRKYGNKRHEKAQPFFAEMQATRRAYKGMCAVNGLTPANI